MARASGYIIDVPVTLSVAVRGVSEKRAKEIARKFADDMTPTDYYVSGYSGALADGVITEVSFESSREESCEVLEGLDQEEEDEGIGQPDKCAFCRNMGHACIDHADVTA